MKEILFKGKAMNIGLYPDDLVKNGDWIFGFYAFSHETNEHYIIRPNLIGSQIFELIQVDPETVGQYTGFNDKNGEKIFYGDTVWNSFLETMRIVSELNVAYWVRGMDKMNDPTPWIELREPV